MLFYKTKIIASKAGSMLRGMLKFKKAKVQ